VTLPGLYEWKVTAQAVTQLEIPAGHLLVQFALLDHQLDYLLMKVFMPARRAILIAKMPYQTGDKINSLKLAFDKLETLGKWRDRASRLLSEIARMNDVRNTIAHGGLADYSDAPEATYVFNRLRYRKPDEVYFLKSEALTLREICACADQIDYVVGEMLDLAADVHGIKRP
jgi:hypothetical protein